MYEDLLEKLLAFKALLEAEPDEQHVDFFAAIPCWQDRSREIKEALEQLGIK